MYTTKHLNILRFVEIRKYTFVPINQMDFIQSNEEICEIKMIFRNNLQQSSWLKKYLYKLCPWRKRYLD